MRDEGASVKVFINAGMIVTQLPIAMFNIYWRHNSPD